MAGPGLGVSSLSGRPVRLESLPERRGSLDPQTGIASGQNGLVFFLSAIADICKDLGGPEFWSSIQVP